MLRFQRFLAFVLHILLFPEDHLRKVTGHTRLHFRKDVCVGWQGLWLLSAPTPPIPVFPNKHRLGVVFYPTKGFTAVFNIFCFLKNKLTLDRCFNIESSST